VGLIKGGSNNLQLNLFNKDMVLEHTFQKENIINILGKCEKEIYRVLLDNSNQEYTKEDLSGMTITNYSTNSGGFNNAISRLRSLGLIKRNNGMIRLNEDLLEI
jgi:predicted transcriptional regulator